MADSIHSGQDLGIGDALSGQKRVRLLNRDGTFNVLRNRKTLRDEISYTTLLQVSWPVFLASVILLFIGVNVAFALGYVWCGRDEIALNGPDPRVNHFLRAFFFSVHTFSTIGYGNLVPVGIRANLLVVVESFFGLFGYSLVTGLLFARFARPTVRFRFARKAVMRTDGRPALLIRLTNESRSEVIEMQAVVVASFFDAENPLLRRYYSLNLERSHINFLPLGWTLAHFITTDSPLYGLTEDRFQEASGEILIQISAIDQASSQKVYSRISYTAEDLEWNARYADMYIHEKHTGLLGIDMERFDGTQPL